MSYESLNLSLCEQFLEEAAFLYEQAQAYRKDPELTWLDAHELEQRLEAHLDGLVVAGEPALDLCSARAKEGPPGELHTALQLFCRQGRSDLVEAVLVELDASDSERAAAAAEALQAACPDAWHAALARGARAGGPAPVVAPTLARGGTRAEALLIELLEAAGETAVPVAAGEPAAREAAEDIAAVPILEALGRVGGPRALSAVAPRVRSEVPAVAAAAATAALRLGDAETARYLLLAARTRPWLMLPAAQSGGAATVTLFRELLQSGQVCEEALLGLGLLGDLSAVRTVFDCLSSPEHAADAALALQLMTGAELFGEVFVPEAFDPDELFDDERALYERTGEKPARADGTPFGANETRLLTDPELWKDWIAENKTRFDPQLRYRYGEPHGPRGLLRGLLAERMPSFLRTAISDELKIRYDCNFPFRVTMPVLEQQRLLQRLAEWVETRGTHFQPGRWYFGGRPLAA